MWLCDNYLAQKAADSTPKNKSTNSTQSIMPGILLKCHRDWGVQTGREGAPPGPQPRGFPGLWQGVQWSVEGWAVGACAVCSLQPSPASPTAPDSPGMKGQT